MNHSSMRLLIVASAAAIALAGCSSSGSSSGSTDSTGSSPSGHSTSSSVSTDAAVAAANAEVAKYLTAPTAIPLTQPLSKRPAAGKKIVIIALLDPNVTPIQNGVEAAASALGWTTTILNYNGTDPSKPNSLLQEAVQQKPNFIAGIGTDSSTLTTGLAAAKAANIPFFPFGDSQDPKGKQNWIFSNVDGTKDFALKAQIGADYVIAQSNGKAKIALVNVPSFPTLKAYGDAYAAEVKAKCPGCSFHAINLAYTDVAAGTTAATVVAYLRSNPSTNNLVYATGSFAIGLSAAASQAGVKIGGTSGVQVTVQSPSSNNLQDIADGAAEAALAPPLTYDGWAVVDAMARYSVGDDLSVNWSAVPPYTILTKARVTGVNSTYPGPTGYQDQFKKLWQISS